MMVDGGEGVRVCRYSPIRVAHLQESMVQPSFFESASQASEVQIVDPSEDMPAREPFEVG